MKAMKRIHAVRIERMYDEAPDASYLEQEGFEDRLQQYREHQFSFMGIHAVAEYCVPIGSGNSSLVQMINSGGLWGIESDSGENYFLSVEEEELSELRDQLHAIGFSKRAIAAAFKNVERS